LPVRSLVPLVLLPDVSRLWSRIWKKQRSSITNYELRIMEPAFGGG
jgi:hypothetical protein